MMDWRWPRWATGTAPVGTSRTFSLWILHCWSSGLRDFGRAHTSGAVEHQQEARHSQFLLDTGTSRGAPLPLALLSLTCESVLLTLGCFTSPTPCVLRGRHC